MPPEEQTWNGRRLALDLSMYKQLGFYQLLDPNGPRVYGRHVYRTVLKLFLLLVQAAVIFGLTGFFFVAGEPTAADGMANRTSPFEVLVILANCTLSSLKMYVLMTNADVIWRLFDMACADFLRCTRHAVVDKDLAARWARSAAVTRLIARSFLAGMFLWFYGPFIIDDDDDDGNGGATSAAYGRRKNIVNVNYPVTAAVYNDFYYAFYAMEMAIGFCIVYGSVLVDAFLMSFCWIIAARYRSMVTAYETFGLDRTDSK